MSKVTKKRIERVAPLTIEEAQTKSKDERLKKCRYCTNTKDSKKFYKSYDFLDTDGKMSICIDCCTYLFNYFYSIHSRMDIAIYEVCKCTNVRFDLKAYSALVQSLEKNNMQATIDAINGGGDNEPTTELDEIAVNTKTSVFGKYIAILTRIYSNKDEEMYFDLYKSDRPEGYEDRTTDKPMKDVIENAYTKHMNALEKKWGSGWSDDDYAFLEEEYNGWAKTKDVDEKSVDVLIKEICLQQLSIRQKRNDGQTPTKADMETLTGLMDKAAITPDKLKEASSQKTMQAWGNWVKDIEQMSPAEWVENQKLFKDVEGIEGYVDRHFGRALKNYIGMQRDFRVVAARMEDEDAGSYDDVLDQEEYEVPDGDGNGE